MHNRGSAVVGFLAAIGLVVVLLGLFLGGCFSSAGATQISRHHPSCDSNYDEDNGRNCNDGTQGGGNGNKGRDGDDQRGDKNCHSFCGNTIIIPMPGSTTTTTGAK